MLAGQSIPWVGRATGAQSSVHARSPDQRQAARQMGSAPSTCSIATAARPGLLPRSTKQREGADERTPCPSSPPWRRSGRVEADGAGRDRSRAFRLRCRCRWIKSLRSETEPLSPFGFRTQPRAAADRVGAIRACPHHSLPWGRAVACRSGCRRLPLSLAGSRSEGLLPPDEQRR